MLLTVFAQFLKLVRHESSQGVRHTIWPLGLSSGPLRAVFLRIRSHLEDKKIPAKVSKGQGSIGGARLGSTETIWLPGAYYGFISERFRRNVPARFSPKIGLRPS